MAPLQNLSLSTGEVMACAYPVEILATTQAGLMRHTTMEELV